MIYKKETEKQDFSQKEVAKKTIFWALLIYCLSCLISSFFITKNQTSFILLNGFFSLISFGLSSFFLAFYLKSDQKTHTVLGLSTPNKDKLKSIFVFSAIFILILIVYFIIINILKSSTQGAFRDLLNQLEIVEKEKLNRIFSKKNISILILNFSFIGFIVPICEELFFRGLLQASFHTLTKNSWIGIIITSLIFSLLHFSILHFFPIFIFGLWVGVLREKTNSIYIGILLHCINNLFTLVNLVTNG